MIDPSQIWYLKNYANGSTTEPYSTQAEANQAVDKVFTFLLRRRNEGRDYGIIVFCFRRDLPKVLYVFSCISSNGF